ncbi:SURF1 family protein [Nakamurella sp. YIM 132087]|uniref:SURF1-like protein n=1 Tax=Nakamurella alba TaxID=2665158 RepID=A0A7K1FT59_9ACTN|nr:SURF1 family cytochrome oxidase biogenesis protein [Nakamurella alba]MTD17318.1 SURF1 family protein [Nakamurella alba]
MSTAPPTHPADTPAPAGPPARAPRRWAFLLRPGWIAAVIGAIVFGLACFVVLAPWQFDRHSEREAQNAAILAATTAAPVPVADLLSTGAEPTGAVQWRQVSATGVFEPEGQVFVRLRQDAAGNPASEVLVPFRLADGGVLLVDRGYMPDDQVRAGTPAPALPTGTVTITGRVQPDQPYPVPRPAVQENGHTLVYGIDSTVLLAGQDGALRGFVQLTADSPAVIAEIPVPQRDSGPFLSYALQWIAFGIIAILAIGYFVVREGTDPRGDDQEEDSAPLIDRAPATRAKFDRSQLYDQE